MHIRLLRNATIIIEVSGKNIIVDPLFSDKYELDPIPWSNEIRNPTVELPIKKTELAELIERTDAVLLTHLHPDHWDTKAQEIIPKNMPVICQPEDVTRLNQQGFMNLHKNGLTKLGDMLVERVPAQHGHGELARKMAPASGFIIKASGKIMYLAGDTVWCELAALSLAKYQPDYIVVNAGAAQFNFGEPVTMTSDDVIEAARNSKDSAKLIVVHMEAINHCYLKRDDLRKIIHAHGLVEKIIVPGDGESVMTGGTPVISRQIASGFV